MSKVINHPTTETWFIGVSETANSTMTTPLNVLKDKTIHVDTVDSNSPPQSEYIYIIWMGTTAIGSQKTGVASLRDDLAFFPKFSK